MDLTVNGKPVLTGSVSIPYSGAWYARLVVDSEEAPSGRVTLASQGGGLTLSGTVTLSETRSGACEVRVVGGGGGLATYLGPRFYRRAPASLIVADILRECGESLAPGSSNALNSVLATWARCNGPGSTSLQHLLDSLGVPGLLWRVTASGEVLITVDAWEEQVDAPGDVVATSPVDGAAELAVEAFFSLYRPGVLWYGQRVAHVEHSLEPQSARTRLYFARQAPGAASGAVEPPSVQSRTLGALEGLLARGARKVLYSALHPATVISASGARLEVRLDSEVLPPMVDVPLLGSSPGEEASLSPGARVLVGFEGASPDKPFAVSGYRAASLASHITRASSEVALEAPSIKLGTGAIKAVGVHLDTVLSSPELVTWFQQLVSKINDIQPMPPLSTAPTTIGALQASTTKAKAE